MDIVAQQRRGLIDVHDQDVEVAVVVKIAEGRATAGMRFGDGRAGAVQKLLEAAAAQVAEQHPRRLVRKLRMLPLHLGEDASRYPEQIWQAVGIQVGYAVPPTDVPGLDTQPGAQRNVLEYEAARIPVQSRGIFGKMGLQHVQTAIRVEIADGNTHASL